MMQTRCPNCQTVYRIQPEQLEASDGLACCCRCDQVFNAHEHKLEEPLQSGDGEAETKQDSSLLGIDSEIWPSSLADPSEFQEESELTHGALKLDASSHLIEESPSTLIGGHLDSDLDTYPEPLADPAWEGRPTAPMDLEATDEAVSDAEDLLLIEEDEPLSVAEPDELQRDTEEPTSGLTLEEAAAPAPPLEPKSNLLELEEEPSEEPPPLEPDKEPEALLEDLWEEQEKLDEESMDSCPFADTEILEEQDWDKGPLFETDSTPDMDDEELSYHSEEEAPAVFTDTTEPPAIAEEGESAPPPTPGGTFSRLAWGSGILALALLLVTQLAWFKREALIESDLGKSLLQTACNSLGCQLPTPKDPSKIQIVSREIISHPSREKALLLNLVISNQAAFPQPYPLIELSLFSEGERLVARRGFSPREYLSPDKDHPDQMEPKINQQIIMELVDPSEQVTGFQFDFL